MYSIEIFNQLSNTYDNNTYQNNNKFWKQIDSIDINHLYLWGNRLSKTKYLSNDNPKEWLTLLDLNRLASNKDIELTQKQKRYYCLMIIKYWNDLSCDYVL